MAVTVVLARYNDKTVQASEVVAEANGWMLVEWHLRVGTLQGSGALVPVFATYAPGQWLSVSRDDSVVFGAH